MKAKGISCIQECFCLEAKMEAYIPINTVVLPTFHSGPTEDQCLEEEAAPLHRGAAPCSLPTPTPSFSTEQIPEGAGPSPHPSAAWTTLGLAPQKSDSPSSMALQENKAQG